MNNHNSICKNYFPLIYPVEFNTPILFLIFNRPDTTARVFECIRNIKPTRLYIASDGPRSDVLNDLKYVQESRRIATCVDWPCRVSTLFRSENLGCKNAVTSSLNWFFDNEESGIVLEDDCLPSQSFFLYCAQLLERFKEYSNVGMISGFSVQTATDDYSYRFSRITNIWGWASWRRSWRFYSPELDPDIVNGAKFYDKFLHHSQLVKNTFLQYSKMEIDTWDIQWIFSVANNFEYSILPSRSLIQNIGFDVRATHTKKAVNRFSSVNASELRFPLNHPRAPVASSIESLDAKYLSIHHGL